MAGDVLSLETDTQAGEPLISQVMRGGRRITPNPSLGDSRALAAHDLERLPQGLRDLIPEAHYPVAVADTLVRLAAEVDARIESNEGAP